jgi:predicted Fe-Mo cluster-binding NifX family protein
MKVAIPEWRGRVSPVFDVAGNLLLIEVENGREVRREERRLPCANSVARTAEFLGIGAGTLICGAISAPVRARLADSGVKVIGFVCGRINEVLAAFLNGDLAKGAFAMPGCKRCSQQQGGTEMPGRFGIGGRRDGHHAKGFGRAAGRIGGPGAAGPGGFCVCSKCGEKVPHTAGQPCIQRVCPKCGAAMART